MIHTLIPGEEVWIRFAQITSLTPSVVSLGTTRDDRLVSTTSAIHKFQTITAKRIRRIAPRTPAMAATTLTLGSPFTINTVVGVASVVV